MGWIVCLLPLHSVTLRVLCSALVLPQFYTALSLLCVMGTPKEKRKAETIGTPKVALHCFCSTSSHRHKGEHKAYAVRSSLELSNVP